MAKQGKNKPKSGQDKAWNRRTNQSADYAIDSRTPFKRFLIYCEGANTEPHYFRSFPVATAEVKVEGLGRSKTSLVERVIFLVEQEAQDPEQEVWIVFDLDIDPYKDRALQRKDFNQAIRLAEEKDFRVAYSNDAFELWFVLHYHLLEAALTRKEFYEKLSGYWAMSYEREGKGVQFCRNIYQRLQANQAQAIRHAQHLAKQHQGSLPAEQNPCTTVHLLVQELNKYLKK